jgi:pimeloyl-ACP methyl ester carboxylesterase
MVAPIALAHATGACGGIWRPVVAELGRDFETLVWDFPGHGGGRPLGHPVDWWDLGRFVLETVPAGAVGVGHSMGGTALVMAEVLAPGTFRGLILVEPILLPPPYQPIDPVIAQRAEKRRTRFPSRAAAREGFAKRLPFSKWHSGALDGYVEGGLVETGGEVELACRPSDEAAIYRSAGAHGAWERLSEVSAPVLIMAGALSDTHPEEFCRQMAGQFRGAGFEIVGAASHFLPMEQPELVANRIRRMAAAL